MILLRWHRRHAHQKGCDMKKLTNSDVAAVKGGFSFGIGIGSWGGWDIGVNGSIKPPSVSVTASRKC